MKRSLVLLFLLITFVFCIFQSCKDKHTFSTATKEHKGTIQIIDYSDSTIGIAYNTIINARKNKNTTLLGKTYFELGYYYQTKSKSDSAFYYFNHAKEEFLQVNDSSFIGKSLLNMAIVQTTEGDYFGSEETAVEALKFLRPPKYSPYIATIYNCLAISKTDQKNYSQAIEYYNQALKYPKDTLTDINIINNRAVVNIKAKNFKTAIKTLSDLLKDPYLKKYPKEIARITDNLAFAQWLNNPSHNAEPELYQTLKIREKIKDSLGQIANHYHLSQYFTKTNPERAIYHADKMYEIASKKGTPDDQLEALQKLISLENPMQAKKYFSTYLHINDSLQTARNQAKNQFALIRYEVEKNKEENLQLKAENAQKKLQIFKQQVIVFSITGFTLLGIITSFFWYKRRKEKFRREKMEEVHHTELKYSKKIHDEVANGIYNLMILLENNPQIEKTNISNNLEDLYNKSRNISHESELKANIKNDFSLLLKEMLYPYGGQNIKIIIIGNDIQLWEKVPANKKEELYYVLVELMTNMKKHSKANLVTLRFKQEKNVICIDYFDNGIGFADKIQKSGKGIKNMESRINSIQGKFYIMNNVENKKGFSIKITVTI